MIPNVVAATRRSSLPLAHRTAHPIRKTLGSKRPFFQEKVLALQQCILALGARPILEKHKGPSSSNLHHLPNQIYALQTAHFSVSTLPVRLLMLRATVTGLFTTTASLQRYSCATNFALRHPLTQACLALDPLFVWIWWFFFTKLFERRVCVTV